MNLVLIRSVLRLRDTFGSPLAEIDRYESVTETETARALHHVTASLLEQMQISYIVNVKYVQRKLTK